MPPTAARPKRAAEAFARSHHHHHHDGSGTKTKKPRFDPRNPSTLVADAAEGEEEEEDLILNADVIGKSGAQPKRNAVNIDGYESDSDNDNFEARARERERRGKKKKGEGEGGDDDDDDDDDMFADGDGEVPDGDGEEEEEAGVRKGKEVTFLDPSEIEGQVMNSTSGGRVSGEILLGGKEKGREEEEDSESSGGEEERDRLPDEVEAEDAAELGAGSKKKHAPRLDAFNLKGEEEEGRFDQSGNYVRKAADPDAVNDNWLEGLNKKDLKRAREAQEKREEERRRKAIEDDAFLTSDLLSTLIEHLDTSESPFEALARLNKSKPTEKKVPRWKQKKLQKDKMDTDEDVASGTGGTDAKEEARRKAVEAITGAADKLYGRGQHDIYEAERELLMRQYRRETGEDWKARAVAAAAAAPKADGGRRSGSSDMWEFRWTDGRDGGALNGPYDGPTMEAWQAAGYFGEGVEFRRVGDDHEWSRLLDTSYLG